MNAAQEILLVLIMVFWTIAVAFFTALITCALILRAAERAERQRIERKRKDARNQNRS